jgi:hypothetical protein
MKGTIFRNIGTLHFPIQIQTDPHLFSEQSKQKKKRVCWGSPSGGECVKGLEEARGVERVLIFESGFRRLPMSEWHPYLGLSGRPVEVAVLLWEVVHENPGYPDINQGLSGPDS